MSTKDSRRTQRRNRAFKPQLAGQLEERLALSHRAVPPFPGAITRGPLAIQYYHGGQALRVVAPNGQGFNVSLYTYNNLLVPGGIIKAFPMSNGRIGLKLGGTTMNSILSIDPLPFPLRHGTAHSYAQRVALQSHVLNIGAIDVLSGSMYQILGYHTAQLSGPLTINGTGVVDRIALQTITPGGSINLGGTLNTFDVATSATFSNGPGLTVGRDINWMNIGTDLNVLGGANFTIDRDSGLQAQPGKGSDNGGQGAQIYGNLNIGSGSSFTVGRSIDAPFVIYGQVNGASRLHINAGGGNLISFGGFHG